LSNDDEIGEIPALASFCPGGRYRRSGVGRSLVAYRYYTRPVTLKVRWESIDGEAAKAMSAIAGRLVRPMRRAAQRRDTGTALGPPRPSRTAMWIGGGPRRRRRPVEGAGRVVAVTWPPWSSRRLLLHRQHGQLKGHRVGVLGGEANTKIVDVLSKEYGLDRAKVFKDIALPDARRAIQSKEVSALLVVIL